MPSASSPMLRSTASSSAVMPPTTLTLPLQAVLVELPQEAEAVRAGEAEEDAVDVGLELREVGAVVGHGERREHLLHDLAAGILEHALEAGAHLVAVGDVVGDHRHALVLERLGAVVGERHARTATRSTSPRTNQGLGLRCVMSSAAATDSVGSCCCADVVVDRERLDGGERADHDLDLVRLDQFLQSWCAPAPERRRCRRRTARPCGRRACCCAPSGTCTSARSMSMPPEASGPVLTVSSPTRIGLALRADDRRERRARSRRRRRRPPG